MSRQFQEFAWHFRRLARAYDDGQLVLVLGSGVGVPYGLPKWDGLLTNLLLTSGRVPRFRHEPAPRATQQEIDEQEKAAEAAEAKTMAAIFKRLAPDPLMQGQIARASYPSTLWEKAMKHQLESTSGHRVLQDDPPNGSLRKIARMLARSLQTNPRRHLSVLTFNYDSLLDQAVAEELAAAELRPTLLQTVRDGKDFERTWLDGGIHIYHLHGYLDEPHPDPVLDADSYVPVLGGGHWSWRCMERALTATGTSSLFIGLSLTDPSLRYLLTRWKSWQTPMTGVYLAPPPYLPVTRWKNRRSTARMYRAIMDLYSAVLDQLHLVCYHLSSFREIGTILDFVGGAK